MYIYIYTHNYTIHIIICHCIANVVRKKERKRDGKYHPFKKQVEFPELMELSVQDLKSLEATVE